jgi:protein-tyrosine-phosphatase/phosphohistidine swiveling domain-containing protein
MARRPLWKACLVLVAACLAGAAGAADVIAPIESGPAPVPGIGASVVGAVGASAVTPLANLPAMPTGLSPVGAAPLAAAAPAASAALPPSALLPATAAPLKAAPVSPAAAAAPGLKPLPAGANPSQGQPNIPGYVGYDASKPIYVPAALASAVLGHNEVGHGLQVAAVADPLKAGEVFDGASVKAPLAEKEPAPLPAFKPPVPALKPLAKFGGALAASSGPEAKSAPVVKAPEPRQAPLMEKLDAKAASFFSGVWSAIKSGFAAPPQARSADLAARVETFVSRRVRRAGDPLETPDGMLVHAPRALRFDALGYRVHFAPPDGAPSTSVLDQPVRVRVERGEGDAGTEALRARFAAFNALIEDNFAALELIAQSSSKMTVKTGRLVLEKVEAMAASYSQMVGRDEAIDEIASVASVGIGFDQAVKGLSDGDLLPPKAVEFIMPIDRQSAHFYINKLHQAALREVGRSDVSSPANMMVKLGRGEDERAVPLVDLSEHPLVAKGRLVSPAFKALVAAMQRSKDTPKGSLILQDHQFWGHFRLGAHSAEVYANFLPPDEGGMLRVRYQEWGTGYDNQTRLYYVARLLQKTGFHVEQDNGFLTAIVDKDHASQTVDEMTDTFALVIQALHATVGIDFALPLLVQGAKDSDEVGQRIDEWVDVVLGEGTLPFYIHDEHEAMVAGWSKYRAGAAERGRLRAGLNRALARLGLPEIPAEVELGQRTIDHFFNAPIEAAIARGQLRLSDKGVVAKTPHYDALGLVASRLEADAPAAARMAEVVSSLDPGLFHFEPVGSLGGLTVERAERRLEPGEIIVLHALRDPKTGQLGFADAVLSDLKPGGSARRLEPAQLFTKLAEQGHPVAPFAPAAQTPGLDHFLEVLHAAPVLDRSMGRRTQGLAASPAHGRPVLARVTYDKAKAARGGFVFVAAYTTPDDLDAIRGAKAVITTSGGLLSHAAITTREMGIPAVILSRAEWRGSAAAFESTAFGAEYKLGSLRGRPAQAGLPVTLPENALVRLDPASGAVEIFPEGTSSALLDAARALERYDEDGDGRVLADWVVNRLGSPSLNHLQKAALSREALDGLVARSLTRVEVAEDLATFYAALPKKDDALARWYTDSAADLFRDAERDGLDFLKEKREAVSQAISIEAVERAARQGAARAQRLRAIGVALQVPKTGLNAVVASSEMLGAEAKARAADLLANDVEELRAHARQVPNATVEVLPRLKAAIAKAKRRGANPAVIARWEAQVVDLEGRRELMMRANAPVVLPLKSVLDMDVTRVGGKAAKLGEISEVVARAGGEVPPGLALTVDAYRGFLKETGIAEKLERIAADRQLSPDERAARARKLILNAPLTATAGVGRAILSALKAQGLDGAMLAVRSSAVDEDGAEAAFAGAGDTHLYVGADELLPHVKEIWASLWNPRALLYRETKGLSTTNLAQAVVVQAMVDSEVSGVAFTADPVSGDSSRLVVNGAFGLGEGVVSGRVAPDQYVVGKMLGREVLPPMIADKKLAIVRGKDGRGTEERKMPAEWRRRRSLSPAKLEKLNAVSIALETHFGYALDIEFGFVGDKLYILQARPVTNAASDEPAPPPLKSVKAAAPKAAPGEAPEAKRVMFVCTGNTCRSPMAERLAKDKLKREGRSDFEVLSRGLIVQNPGVPMTQSSEFVMRERGVDYEGHAALGFMPSDAIWADVILTMTRSQAQLIRDNFPQAKGKVFSLGEYSGVGGDVADPYGQDVSVYRAAAAQISAGVDAALDRAETPAR